MQEHTLCKRCYAPSNFYHEIAAHLTSFFAFRFHVIWQSEVFQFLAAVLQAVAPACLEEQMLHCRMLEKE